MQSEPYRPYGPYTLVHLRHSLCPHCMQFGTWMSTCHRLVICSSVAWEAYPVSSLHAASEIMAHMACPHYMQLWSLRGICDTTITCRSGVHRAYVMPSLSAISELKRHMLHPRLLLCIAWYYFVSLNITSYIIALSALHTLSALNPVASNICTMSPSYAVLQIGWAYAMPSLYAVQELARHMLCHHLCNFWACDACAMPSLHAVPKLMGHLPCHHYMQVWSIWGMCHAFIKCNFRACKAYAMPSAITSYWFALVCITLYYFILHCTLSLIDPMGPKPWCLQDMYHVVIMCSPGAYMGICHILITCSPWACNSYAMPSPHAISELGAQMPCPHYMQFLSLVHICHALITCNSGIYWAYAMPTLNEISELWAHMLCPPVIALYCIVLLCVPLYYVVLCCTLSLIDPMCPTTWGL